ncbi:DUF4062 domain-containing protein [Bradyrhizobium sp. OAE829]|uniref:DUF4062 domain-containing protein n=1 Tax=Bradyrhizobium sp. OAE829 TaxID=2663807 RepID=UPI00178A8670
MDKVYQVFVSSTFSDLAEERRQVSNTLAKAGYVVAGMELFPATDEQQLDFIKRIIDRSDYYVVIVAGRYGSLADDEISFTESEFEYARSKGISVLAFIHGQPNQIAVGKTDTDPEQVRRLDAFRAKLRDKRIVKFWTDTGELCTQVVIAITQATNLKPGIGWVRGDQAIDPKVLQEAQRLRIENNDLRQRLEALDGEEIYFNPNLLGPDDNMEFALTGHVRESEQIITGTANAKIGEIFVAIYDRLLVEPSEQSLRSDIGAYLSDRLPENLTDVSHYTVLMDDVIKLRNQLEAHNLLEAFGTIGGTFVKSSYISWRPTDKGRRYAAKKRAALRNALGGPVQSA